MQNLLKFKKVTNWRKIFMSRKSNRYNVDESLETPFSFEHFKRAGKYINRYKKQMIISFFLSLLAATIALSGPLIIRHVVDIVLPNKDKGALIFWAIIFLLTIFISTIFSTIRSRKMIVVGQDIVYDIRSDLFKHLQKLPFKYYDDRPHGRILIRVVNYVNSVSDVLSNGIINVFLEMINIIIIVVFMFLLNVKLSLVVLSGLPIFMLTLFFVKDRQRRAWQDVSNKRSNTNAYLQESILGIEITQLFNREVENKAIFDDLADDQRKSWLKAVRYNALIPFVVDNLANIVGVLIYAVGLLFMDLGTISLGVILAMGSYAASFWRPILNLANLYNGFINGVTYLERIFETMDEPIVVKDKENAYTLPEVKGNVEFKNVSFGYEEGQVVLDKVNFKAKQGESIALVGPTGSGKSTIINLLARFYDLNEGEITLDEHNIMDVKIESLRSQMGIMMQDGYIFKDTIKENIRYGNLEATDEEIVEVSKIVHAHDFIMQQEKGYETVISESDSLSEGQKQLISFARTLISDPKILILDEATSSIDPQTEGLIQKGLNALLKGRTSFIVAHRLSTIQNSDQIFFIANKNIAEKGNHESLMKKEGLYYNMVMSSSKKI